MTETANPLAVLEIDLTALEKNIRLIQNRVAPTARVAGVVKADAYGLGMAEIAAVHQKTGTPTFFAATPEEGERLRALLGPVPEIALLCGLVPGAAGFYRGFGLTPVLNSLGQLAEWRVEGGAAPAMLHLDTGMNRLGLDRVETARLLSEPALLDGIGLTALLSHFACADEANHPMTKRQKDDFERITAQILAQKPGIRRSLANSAGIFASSSYYYDLVRPGMAVFGLNPTPGQGNPMQNVVKLRARILQIRQIGKNETIGYGATCLCPAPRRAATIGLGYADGFLRSLSNRGVLFWNGQPCPVLGRVSMDLVTVDVTDVTGRTPREGDWIDVLGPDQGADELAEQAGTIGYEILTSLGARYQRRYRRAPDRAEGA